MQMQSKPRPEFDVRRVDTIRTQVDDNRYIVNPRQVADKFANFEAALHRRHMSWS